MELSKRALGRTVRAEDARCARLVLLLAEGEAWAAIRDKLNCGDSFIKSLEPALSCGTAGRIPATRATTLLDVFSAASRRSTPAVQVEL